jgi:hypothetical protein
MVTKHLFFLLLVPIAVACSAPEKAEPVRLSSKAGFSAPDGNLQEMGRSDKPVQEMVPGQVLVRFREGTDPGDVQRIQEATGVRVLKAFSGESLFLMKIVDGSSVENAIRRLEAYPEILYAEPNYGRRLKDD